MLIEESQGLRLEVERLRKAMAAAPAVPAGAGAASPGATKGSSGQAGNRSNPRRAAAANWTAAHEGPGGGPSSAPPAAAATSPPARPRTANKNGSPTRASSAGLDEPEENLVVAEEVLGPTPAPRRLLPSIARRDQSVLRNNALDEDPEEVEEEEPGDNAASMRLPALNGSAAGLAALETAAPWQL